MSKLVLRRARPKPVVDAGCGLARGDPADRAHLGQPQLGLPGRGEPAPARERRRSGLDARPRGELPRGGAARGRARHVRDPGRSRHEARSALAVVELDPDAARRALLLVWLGGIWLSYVAFATGRVFPALPHRQLSGDFAVQALALSDVARGRLRPAAAVVAVAVAAAFVAFTVAFHSFLDEQGGAAGDYGIVYRDKDALAELLQERRAPRRRRAGCRLADHGHDERPAVHRNHTGALPSGESLTCCPATAGSSRSAASKRACRRSSCPPRSDEPTLLKLSGCYRRAKSSLRLPVTCGCELRQGSASPSFG